jgi:hypothetical protein
VPLSRAGAKGGGAEGWTVAWAVEGTGWPPRPTSFESISNISLASEGSSAWPICGSSTNDEKSRMPSSKIMLSTPPRLLFPRDEKKFLAFEMIFRRRDGLPLRQRRHLASLKRSMRPHS